MGCGPVHALDNALRGCLRSEFPELEGVRLADYRVSVVDAGDGTAAQVRVVIAATNAEDSWEAEAISTNIIDASFDALCSAWVTGIARARLVTAELAATR
jgi:2-isopropylmalate synthase